MLRVAAVRGARERGGLIAMLIAYAVNRSLQHDFAQQGVQSLRVKDPRPLGEYELARMLESDR